jgi:hypothetical protein
VGAEAPFGLWLDDRALSSTEFACANTPAETQSALRRNVKLLQLLIRVGALKENRRRPVSKAQRARKILI